ncbi:O-antigen ligase family protein [Mucilaginibacter sp. UYCu711]|uniref:O-antigen ligase family protein n=1 Tax=Mucilaginibacter sp. UYCu711 TaxID=3156339 RepID=UPI003D1DF785
MMENIFSWLVLPISTILLAIEKLMSLVILGTVLYHFMDLKRNEKIYIGAFLFVMLRLILESVFKFGTLFQQFTLFTILFPVVFAIYIKVICRTLELDLLDFIAKFYLGVYVLVMVIYGRGFNFSLNSVEMKDYGPFSGDTRIIHARSIFMIIIPFLWSLSKMLRSFKIKYLLVFLFCLTVILVHQHRSVWASTIFATLIFMFMGVRNNVLHLPKAINLIILTLIAFIITILVLSSIAPNVISTFTDRFSEILDPNREGGTGHFRAQQREAYFKLFLQRPVFGWTFDGFDMPNPLVDWWPPKSGQHFHEGYIEMLFYHGVAGIVLKYWILIYLAFKAFSKKLNQEAVVLISFCTSGLIFSFSYVLPLIFWGHVGLCLYYLEKDEDIVDAAEVKELEIT